MSFMNDGIKILTLVTKNDKQKDSLFVSIETENLFFLEFPTYGEFPFNMSQVIDFVEE